MQHRDRNILEKILSEIDVAEEMLSEISLPAFLSNEMMKRAVAMTIINVGELIKNVSDDLKKEHPEVSWRAAAGMRDLTAHKYQTLRMEDVYETAVRDFPELKQKLQHIMRES